MLVMLSSRMLGFVSKCITCSTRRCPLITRLKVLGWQNSDSHSQASLNCPPRAKLTDLVHGTYERDNVSCRCPVDHILRGVRWMLPGPEK
jgi:hypothetical protein